MPHAPAQPTPPQPLQFHPSRDLQAAHNAGQTNCISQRRGAPPITRHTHVVCNLLQNPLPERNRKSIKSKMTDCTTVHSVDFLIRFAPIFFPKCNISKHEFEILAADWELELPLPDILSRDMPYALREKYSNHLPPASFRPN